ncbi:unnamed protein product [Phytophthora fragariaefolia]|uniref:Unnamed protein product n=1 Tax=Phytophthora fragariaefolia TaxID=1490495 RepID=A0A9W7CZW4_9STRA|nr:unnamed protein product [Phytophthora fragariaefolia]
MFTIHNSTDWWSSFHNSFSSARDDVPIQVLPVPRSSPIRPIIKLPRRPPTNSKPDPQTREASRITSSGAACHADPPPSGSPGVRKKTPVSIVKHH